MKNKYEIIKDDIIKEIHNGKFKPGDKLYSENQLKQMYNVSSITVVKALQDLVSDGVVVRYQGKGTFVSKRKRAELVQLTDLEYTPNEESITVINIETLAKEEYPDALDAKEEYIKISRVKKNGKKPYNFIISIILKSLIKDESLKKSTFSSVYETVLKDSGINLLNQNFSQRIFVEYPADFEETKYLELKETDPIVKQIFINKNDEGKLLEYTTSYKKWDSFEILIESPTKE